MNAIQDGYKIRFAEIDLLRFLAAFAVMFYHYTVGGYVYGYQVLPVRYPQLISLTQYGYLGVDLFFLISGFVILMTAIDRTAKSFLISRMVRLYPAFWVCCTLTFLISSLFGPDFLKVPLNTYLANMTMFYWAFPGYAHVDPVYWSLVVELKFYALVFLVVAAKQMRHVRYLLGLWLIVSIVSLHIPSLAVENFLITKQSSGFIAGAVFYLIWKEGLCPYKICLLAGSYVLSICNAFEMLIFCVNSYRIFLNPDVMIGLITGFYGIFVLIALDRLRRIRCELFIKLGVLTYPLYLLHSRIGSVIFNNGYTVIHKDILLLIIVTFALVLAWLVHTQVEVKFAPAFKKFLQGTGKIKER